MCSYQAGRPGTGFGVAATSVVGGYLAHGQLVVGPEHFSLTPDLRPPIVLRGVSRGSTRGLEGLACSRTLCTAWLHMARGKVNWFLSGSGPRSDRDRLAALLRSFVAS